MTGLNHLMGFRVAILFLSLLLPITAFSADPDEFQPLFDFQGLQVPTGPRLDLNTLSAPTGKIETAKSLRLFTNENQTVKLNPSGQNAERLSWQMPPPAVEAGRSPIRNRSKGSGKILLFVAFSAVALAGTTLLARFFLKRPQ